MDVANNANVQACAACKHHRKRCNFDTCPLAPYFPANRSEEFLNVNRFYGVKHLIKILHSVPEHLRHKTAETLILEATMRKEFPASGSVAVQAQTQVLIREYEKELELVEKKISFYKKMKKTIPHTYNHVKKKLFFVLQPPPTVESTGDANLVSEAITGENNCEYSAEEGGEFKCLDMQRLHELIDSYKAFASSGVSGEGEPSMRVHSPSDVVDFSRSEAREKQPTVCDESEETEDEEIE